MEYAMANRIAFFCVIMGISLAAHNSPASDPESNEPDSVVVTSMRQLRKIQSSGKKGTCRFRMDVTLGFVSANRGVLDVQQNGMPLGVAAEPREILKAAKSSRLAPGVELRIEGRTREGSRWVDAESIEVINEGGQIYPVDSGLLPGKKRAGIHRYVKIRGRVQQIYRAPANGHFRVALDVDRTRVDVEVHECPSVNYLLELLGRTVEAHGVLRHPNLRTPKLLAMHKDQITVINDTPTALNGPPDSWQLKSFRCSVRYSDMIQKAIASVDNETDGSKSVVLLESLFAKEIRYRQEAEVYGVRRGLSQQFATPVERFEARLINIRGLKQSAPNPLPSKLSQLADPNDIPVERVTLEGEVVSKVMRENVCEMSVRSGDGMFHVTTSTEPLTGTRIPFERGDFGAFTGLPIHRRGVNGENAQSPTTNELVLFAASPEDWVVTGSPILMSRQSIVWLVGVAVVIAALVFLWTRALRHQVANRTKSLDAATSYLTTSFEAVGEGILLNDEHGRVSQVNDRFTEMFSCMPNSGDDARKTLLKSVTGNLQASEFSEFVDGMFETNAQRNQVELALGDRHLKIYSSPIADSSDCVLGLLWSFEDITDQRRLEHELLQSQKMEAIGLLSGGVAHDLNNILTVIGSNLALLELQAKANGTVIHDYADPISSAVSQAAELTEHLLDFSRRSRLSVCCVDANELVGRVFRLARRTIDSTIHVNLFLQPCTLPVNVDAARIEQVLLNLCINARDAISTQHGVIKLRTRQADHPSLGSTVCIEVEDNGSGMTGDTLKRIFEPFFTTKQRGAGTGLGLSTAIGVIHQHGGEIECDSEWGQGTTFRVFFKQATTPLSTQTEKVVQTEHEPRNLRLLLVDDEELLRVAGQRVLNSMGHQVVTAANGRIALDILKQDIQFDAILLDLTMPEMSGNEAFDAITERWPHIPIAICSGYSNQYSQFDDAGSTVAFLPKPFRIEEMKATLERITSETT